MRIAAVLWNGNIGGAETFTAALCRTMRELGVEVGIVFVSDGKPLDAQLDADAIPHWSLGLRRGSHVIGHPRRLAQSVRAFDADGALLPRAGYLAAALRAGRFKHPLVAVAHDALATLGPSRPIDRVIRRVDRLAGLLASDVDVAVSDFVLAHMRRQVRRRRLVRIYNGVDLSKYRPGTHSLSAGLPTIGCAARLVEGKGIDVLIRAFAGTLAPEGARLRIAGNGPTRPAMERLASELGVEHSVQFTGWSSDMPAFWRSCDIAALPSDRAVESFGMAAVEAMACARPVVATANGALPELVADGATGSIVPRGDAEALGAALLALARDPHRRHTMGVAARTRCEQLFDIRDCAAAYLGLFEHADLQQ